MIKIIDNVIPKNYQDELENYFLGPSFPWFFSDNLTGEDNWKRIGFFHRLTTFDQPYISEEYNYVIPLVEEISKKIKVNISSIHGRSFLQIPFSSSSKTDLFHIDIDEPHLVYLYYVNDSDGNTVISKEKFLENKTLFKSKEYIPEILQEVCPKKGRVVIFDGLLYHAAGIPQKNPRCVLNFSVIRQPLDIF